MPDWEGGPRNGQAEGCYNLGRAIRDGISYDRNPSVARQYFATACRLGHQAACRESGGLSGGRR
ncbi:MAG: SEL1-like repeat protein [Nitrospiraceae bacterium]|nr:SEL1-like repeat protein [Nitrospiraceae bacterium]